MGVFIADYFHLQKVKYNYISEVETLRELSQIHVEWAIGHVKYYRLFQHNFPISPIKTTAETEYTNNYW